VYVCLAVKMTVTKLRVQFVRFLPFTVNCVHWDVFHLMLTRASSLSVNLFASSAIIITASTWIYTVL
jgi:hypothetical protein